MTLPPSFLVGKKHVLLTSTKGLSRVITDFDSSGQMSVLTVVTEKGAWRLFSDGSTQGEQPVFVAFSGDAWAPESPTKPDTPSVMPPKNED